MRHALKLTVLVAIASLCALSSATDTDKTIFNSDPKTVTCPPSSICRQGPKGETGDPQPSLGKSGPIFC